MTPKIWFIKETSGKLDFIKIQYYCFEKTSRGEREATEWENISAIPYVTKDQPEPSKLNSKKNPNFEKWSKDLNT